jgi:hypothetical protein
VPFKWRQKFATRSVRQNIDDVADLAKKYVLEETVEPLKKLGRYAMFGALGSVFVGLGSLFVLVGILRVLQTETTAFHGDLSWIPYLIVMFLAVGEMGLVGWAIVSGPAKRRLAVKDES